MRVQVATRKCDVPRDVRDRAVDLVEKMDRFDPRISSAELVFQEEKLVRRVEGIVKVDGSDPVVVTGEGADFASATDAMADKLAKVLRRRRSQLKDRKVRAVTGENLGD